MIFNKSITTGVFPDKLKVAFLMPIYRKGDSCLITNCRPVCMLNIISLVFEKVMYNITDSKIINQHRGFTKHRSTASNLVEYTNYSRTSQYWNLKVPIFFSIIGSFPLLRVSIIL